MVVMRAIVLCFAFLFLAVSVLSNLDSSVSQKLSPNDMVDSHISQVKSYLQHHPDTPENQRINADMWRRLGLLLQTKDVRQHVGGGLLQPEALRAFNRALELNDDRDIALSVQVHQHKGMLLKMMSRGEEAILSHDIAFELATNDKDKCESLSNKASALVMLGRVPQAIDLYEAALKLCPLKLSMYLPLVQCYQELGGLNRSGWMDILDRTEMSLRGAIRMDSGGGDVDSSASTALVHSMDFSKQHIDSDGSSIFWALYEVGRLGTCGGDY